MDRWTEVQEELNRIEARFPSFLTYPRGLIHPDMPRLITFHPSFDRTPCDRVQSELVLESLDKLDSPRDSSFRQVKLDYL